MTPGDAFTFVDDPSTYRPTATVAARIPAAARGKRKLLGALSQGLRFPSYFGGNWDALEECLRDLSWLGPTPHVAIVHEGLPLSPRGEQWAIYVGILREAVAAHAEANSAKLEIVFATWTREAIFGSSEPRT